MSRYLFNGPPGLRQQQIAEAQALQQNPLNMLNAVRSGQQMQVAQQPSVGVSNPGMMQQVAGPDLLGAAQNQYSAQLGAVNAANQASGNFMSGLMGMGGSILGGPAGSIAGNAIGGMFG